MKAIRRSMKGEKHDTKQAHISISQKSAIAILPPKKVIRALYDYQPDPSNPHELGFHKGDFFHVLSRENDEDWYEACNPGVEGARGLVPVSYFETIGKTERQSTESSTFNIPQPGQRRSSATLTGINNGNSGHSDIASSSASMTRGTVSAPVPQRGQGGGRGNMVYGTVLYDFQAERDDELSASQGESIIIIAQSTAEWFVAKPIGRLGGPGLIPITFIEIRDMTSGQVVTDPAEAIHRAGVPSVIDWKRMAAEYKAGSISLGKIEAPNGAPGQPGQGNALQQGMERMSLKNGQYYGNGTANRGSQRQQYTQRLAPGKALRTPISASVPRYCFEDDKYRFIIECFMSDGTSWELSRYYQDFYDLQVALLREFPEQQDPEERVLPYVPGPVNYVTDDISNKRRVFLDEYIRRLLALDPSFAHHDIVKDIFDPREGDFELDPKALQDEYRLSQQSEHSYPGPASSSVSRQTSHSQINNSFAQQQRYMGGQYQAPAQQYSNRNQHQAYQGMSYQQHYAEQPAGLYGPDTSYFHDDANIDFDPRTTKLKFWFMSDLKKARVENFGYEGVKRAVEANIRSLNQQDQDVQIYYVVKGEGGQDVEEVITSDEHVREAFRIARKPVVWARFW